MLGMNEGGEIQHVHMLENGISVVGWKITQVACDLLSKVLPLAFNLVEAPNYHTMGNLQGLIYWRLCLDVFNSLFDHPQVLAGVVGGFCDVVHDIGDNNLLSQGKNIKRKKEKGDDNLCALASKQEFEIMVPLTCDNDNLVEIVINLHIDSPHMRDAFLLI